MFEPTIEQLEGPIADMLRKQRDLVRFYWDDQSEAEQAIASGEVVVAYAWLDAETGKWLIENYNYGHSNAKAFELADQQLLEELGWSSPDSQFDEGIFFEPYDPQVEERYTVLFEEIKAGF